MFYDTFKLLCDAKGVSCNRAALDIGLSNATPTKWKKTGATPDSTTLAKISRYFDVSVDYLLLLEDMPWEKAAYELEALKIEIARTPSDARYFEDPDIRMIARAGHKMTPEQRENLRKYAQFMYPEAFEDDDT